MRLILATLLACCLTTTAAAGVPDCETEPRVQPAAIPQRVILVGESHGTEEAPAFVGRLLCGLLRSGRPVVLALERDAEEQPDIDRFLASPGSKRDLQALLTVGDWAQPNQDGRSSTAMLALLDLVRQWRQAGTTVPVVALRGAIPNMDDPKRLQVAVDRSMADGVTAALQAHRGHTVVVLAGSFHTAVASKMHQDIIQGPSMGDELASRGPVHVIGLFSSVGGTRWKWGSNAPEPGVGDEAAGPFDVPDAHIDTRVDLGRLTPSRPARERLD